MMMKHSRWSGRRLMPSGGGWMTPNPSGGVAACLVWEKDGQCSKSEAEVGRVTAAASCHSTDASDDAERPVTYGNVHVSTSITVVPYQQTVLVEAPPASSSDSPCPQHCVSSTGSRRSAKPQQFAAAAQRPKPTPSHGLAKQSKPVGECRHCHYCCLDESRPRHHNVVDAQSHSKHDERNSKIVVDVDVERPPQKPVRTSRAGIPLHSSSKVVRRSVSALPPHQVQHSMSASKVATSSTSERSHDCHQEVSGRASGRQKSDADLASYTDQLTSNLYASMSEFKDFGADYIRENDVIDAVRGAILRRPPSPPQSFRGRRPGTSRRPSTPGALRTVELRQGDVGPLSSLVVIRPATPQPRTARTQCGTTSNSVFQPNTD